MKLSTISQATSGHSSVATRADDGRDGKGFDTVLDEVDPAGRDSAAGSGNRTAASGAGGRPAVAKKPAGDAVDLAALANRAAKDGNPAASTPDAEDLAGDLAAATGGEPTSLPAKDASRTGDQDAAGDVADPAATPSAVMLPFLNLAALQAVVPPTGAGGPAIADRRGTSAASTTSDGATLPSDAGATLPSDAGAMPASGGSASLDSQITPGSVAVETYLGFSKGLDLAAKGSPLSSAIGAGRVKPAPSGGVDAMSKAATPSTAEALDSSTAVLASAPAPADSVATVGADAKGTDQPDAQIAPASQSATGANSVGAGFAQTVTPLIARVSDGIATLAASPAAAVAPAETAGTQIGPAKTMTLQLSPDGLGTLSIRLHVSGRALDVHLDASNAETARIIDRDRSALTNALSGRDYQVQSLTVASGDTTMQGAMHADRGTDQGSANTGSSGQKGSTSDGNGQQAGQGSDQGASRQDDGRAARRPRPAAIVSRGGGSSSLFV